MRTSNRINRRRGSVLAYVAVAMTAFAGFVSLAVDWGHVRYVKTQLQGAADAGARHGAVALLSDYTQAASAAATAAGYNTADAAPVSISQTADVQLGTWHNSTFTLLTGTAAARANAIRVYARHTVAAGNPVQLSFASLVGKSTCDVSASAIAVPTPVGYGLVGLNYIQMGGNSLDSYWSPNGYTNGGGFTAVASNGPITLGGNSQVFGNANPGVGYTVSNPSAVTGSTDPLTSPLVYPKASPTAYSASNNNSAIPASYMSGSSLALSGSQSLTLPGGTYYFNNVSIGGSASISFSGPATIYVYGSIDLSGGANTTSNLPGNLNIIVGPDTSGNPPGTISLKGGSALYANIYAPQSDITMVGSGDIYGSVVGQSITNKGTSSVHYDVAARGILNVKLVQ